MTLQMSSRCIARLAALVLLSFSSLGFAQALASPVTTDMHPAAGPVPQGFAKSTPEALGFDSDLLADAIEAIRADHIRIHSLYIVRNGAVLLDVTFFPFRKGDVHDIASMTKSVTSTLVGIAADERKLAIDEPVVSIFPDMPIANRDARKERMTVADLLSMESGLDCRPDDAEITLREMRKSPHWGAYMLDLPMVADPGSNFSYCSGGMHLLSGIISRSEGMNALATARGKLFGPLGIDKVTWPADPDGVSYGWGDLHLSAESAAKIGALWLQHGRWGNRQLVSAAFMDDATRVHHRIDDSRSYGYGFWVFRSRHPPMFEAAGRGGQVITVIPGWNIVSVMLGGGFEAGDVGKYITPALKSDSPLPPNARSNRRLAKAIAAAALPPPPDAPTALPAVAEEISGKTYLLEENPLGLKFMQLTFESARAARLAVEFTDGRRENRPVGLDGVPRMSPDGKNGRTVALTGAWRKDGSFMFDYDTVSDINDYTFLLTPNGTGLKIDLSERTGLFHTTLSAGTVRNSALR